MYIWCGRRTSPSGRRSVCLSGPVSGGRLGVDQRQATRARLTTSSGTCLGVRHRAGPALFQRVVPSGFLTARSFKALCDPEIQLLVRISSLLSTYLPTSVRLILVRVPPTQECPQRGHRDSRRFRRRHQHCRFEVRRLSKARSYAMCCATGGTKVLPTKSSHAKGTYVFWTVLPRCPLTVAIKFTPSKGTRHVGAYAVFREQGSCESQTTAAQGMDVIARLPGL